MMKRFIALLLCLVMCATAFVGCAEKDEDDKGAYITMYLTNEVYSFDPAYAFNNEEAEQIASLLFTKLFTLTEKGKLKYELADSYTTKSDEKTNEHTMTIKLKTTWWSDKTQVTADDVVFAWKRLLNPENSFSAAALLYDIKNARAVKQGDCSIDDLGVYALNDTTLEISFEQPIDYDRFLLNLTSLALAPLREDYVSKTDDWAKKPGTMVTSGPFKLSKVTIVEDQESSVMIKDTHGTDKDKETGEIVPTFKPAQFSEILTFALERNAFFYRNPEEAEDIKIDKAVTPYRIYVDCTMTAEKIAEAYQNGDIFYIGDIPVSLRTDDALIADAQVKDAMSTATLLLNQQALVKNKSTGEEVALFADANVRRALSLVLDRNAIAKSLVFADAATALVPTGIYNERTSGSFRTAGGDMIATKADKAAAQKALSDAGVKASDYAFDIIVNPHDDEMMVIAAAASEAWNDLGFTVTVKERGTTLNNEYYAPVADIPKDICDELYLDHLLYREFEVLVIDTCAYNADAYSVLAPFATLFSGMVDSEMNLTAHYSGYTNPEYDALIEAVYYLPYINTVTALDYARYGSYNSADEMQAVLDACKAIYTKYGVDTAKVDAGRAILLHEAEKMLVDEMAVIPVVFNKTATLQSDALSKVKSDLFSAYNFQKTVLKDYEDYVEQFELVYSGKALYRCSKCGWEILVDAGAAKEDLPTKCGKKSCADKFSDSEIFGVFPVNRTSKKK